MMALDGDRLCDMCRLVEPRDFHPLMPRFRGVTRYNRRRDFCSSACARAFAEDRGNDEEMRGWVAMMIPNFEADEATVGLLRRRLETIGEAKCETVWMRPPPGWESCYAGSAAFDAVLEDRP